MIFHELVARDSFIGMGNLTVEQALLRAVEAHKTGELQDAERLYRAILEVQPKHPDANHNLGILALGVGKPQDALPYLKAALETNPNQGQYWISYVNALIKANNPDDARKVLNQGKKAGLSHEAIGQIEKQLISISPHTPTQSEINTLLQHFNIGEFKIAEGLALAMTRRFPNYPFGWTAYGAILRQIGSLNSSLRAVEEAVRLSPNNAQAHNNRGNALRDMGRLTEAEASFREAIKLKPDYAEAHSNLGNALQDMGRLTEAKTSFREAIKLKPDYAEAHSNLGNALQELGRMAEAIAEYDLALNIDPDFGSARWHRGIAVIPIIQTDAKQIQTSRETFRLELIRMSGWFADERLDHGHNVVGAQHPFYLAYQEEDNKLLLAEYGQLCHKLMTYWQRQQNRFFQPQGIKVPIRMGIVSKHIYGHSVWESLIQGWIQYLDRRRIEITIFYVGTKNDEATQYARSVVESFVSGKANLPAWVDAILERNIDILFYPEIGMDKMTVKLASLRLAPVQLASWGHPETTGLPTMDYYISANLLEPDCSESYYTEQLVKLPNLGCCYGQSPVTPVAPDYTALGIKESCPLLICPGTPFKYVPEHDWIFVSIAKQLGQCQFVFFIYEKKELSQLVKERLNALFSTEGMDFNDFGVFIPWQAKASFYGLMLCADVFLDTVGFSGFNTAMQATECGLPIVTREGRFMRGRMASGILKRIELQELIANNEDQYVALVVRLVRDRQYNLAVRQKIEANRLLLYDDREPVLALENFLLQVCRKTIGDLEEQGSPQTRPSEAKHDQS